MSSGLTERRITTRAREVRVLRQGSGEGALLLHGIGSTADSFRRQLAELSDAFKVVAWDAPGYGASGELKRQMSLDEYAEAAVDVIDAESIDRAHLVGVSWGGVIATRLALRHPGRISSLNLIASTPGRAGNAAAIESLRSRAALAERGKLATYAGKRARELLAEGALPALAREVEEIMLAAVHPAGFRSAAESLARANHALELDRITVSTLVIVGDEDRITGLEESRALASGIPGARLAVVESCGHLPNQEKPEVVNAELRAHFSSVRERRSS